MKCDFLSVPAHCHETVTDTSKDLVSFTEDMLCRSYNEGLGDGFDEERVYLKLVKLFTSKLEMGFHLGRTEDEGMGLVPYELLHGKKRQRASDTDVMVRYQQLLLNCNFKPILFSAGYQSVPRLCGGAPAEPTVSEHKRRKEDQTWKRHPSQPATHPKGQRHGKPKCVF